MAEEPVRRLIPTRIVLVRPLQPGNVGSVARAMANFGFNHLALVAPAAFDPDHARWMAPGAAGLINDARFVPTVEEAVGDATLVLGTTTRQRRWHRKRFSPEEAMARLLEAGDRGALLFGPEDTGLSNEDLALCEGTVTIDTAGHESLNLAQAAVVVLRAGLVEAQRQGVAPPRQPRQRSRGGGKSRPKAPPKTSPVASVALRQEVVHQAVGVLEQAGYLRNHAADQVATTLFTLLGRASPSEAEINMLRGMLSKTRWKIEH